MLPKWVALLTPLARGALTHTTRDSMRLARHPFQCQPTEPLFSLPLSGTKSMKSLRLRLLVSNGRCHHALQHSSSPRARFARRLQLCHWPICIQRLRCTVCAQQSQWHTPSSWVGTDMWGCTGVRGDSLICHPADCLVTGGQPVPVASVAKRHCEIG